MTTFQEDEWRPATEAEIKVITARRERSDKISKVMSGYLLKGYRMLATSCSKCDTIELRDKQGQIYCVACSEVDVDDNSKDNPVLSAQAASHQIAEHSIRSLPVEVNGFLERPQENRSRLPIQESLNRTSETVDSVSLHTALEASLAVVTQKLDSATEILKRSENPEQNEIWIAYIKSCAECISAIKTAQKA